MSLRFDLFEINSKIVYQNLWNKFILLFFNVTGNCSLSPHFYLITNNPIIVLQYILSI